MELKQGTLLQNGKYRIEKVLGQGGFGITYMAEQTGLERKVAIKEFFMKEYCNRDEDTSQVSVPSVGSKELVSKFRQKFVREAKMIASMENPHIVTIHEVFEENNTAYYVMQHIEGGSLNERVPIDAVNAEKYIRQIADALRYCHSHKILHLDVKPSNVLVNKGNAVLIDFGISKHYDESGSQTSSTPVGISKGYAPLEQYDRGDISKFGAATDIYSLGATLYKLLTGETPPDANYVNENGISVSTAYPTHLRAAIIKSMESKRKDRPQSIDAFLSILDGNSAVSDEEVEVTIIDDDQGQKPRPEPVPAPGPTPNPSPEPNPKPKKIWKVLMIVMVLIGVIGGYYVVEGIQERKAEQARLEQSRLEQARKERERQGIYEVNGVTFKMIKVEGGTFQMGATSEQGSEADSDEKPVHSVTLSDYYIGETEVTQELWEAVMGSNPSYFKGDQKPVENVSWNDCQEFIRKLNALTGKNFRLPTEAEWEYAARGGNKSKGYKYSGSNSINNVAWYDDNSNSQTHNVKTKSPNELGIYDMSGNVWESCQDWYGDYSSSSQTNPKGPSSGSYRVLRGGCWYSNARYCRVSYRYDFNPDNRPDDNGLRLSFS